MFSPRVMQYMRAFTQLENARVAASEVQDRATEAQHEWIVRSGKAADLYRSLSEEEKQQMDSWVRLMSEMRHGK